MPSHGYIGRGEEKKRVRKAGNVRGRQLRTGGAWVAQSVKRLTSTQVMISQSVSSSPASGSVLTSQSLESASDSIFPSLPLSLSLSLKNKLKKSYKSVIVWGNGAFEEL